MNDSADQWPQDEQSPDDPRRVPDPADLIDPDDDSIDIDFPEEPADDELGGDHLGGDHLGGDHLGGDHLGGGGDDLDEDSATDIEDEASYDCPSCGEEIVIPLDPSAGNTQDYVEDCPVCCAPNVLRVSFAPDGYASVQAERE